MMPFTVSEAILADREEILEIALQRDKLMRAPIKQDYHDHFAFMLDQKYLNDTDPRYKLLVAKCGGQIVSMIGMMFWLMMPHWTLVHMKVRKAREFAYFNPTKNGLAAIMDRCVETAEGRGVYRYYSIYAKSSYHQTKDLWTTHVPRMKDRYEWSVELVVPKGTMPSYKFAQELMVNRTSDVDLVIRSGSLRNELRPEYLALERQTS